MTDVKGNNAALLMTPPRAKSVRSHYISLFESLILPVKAELTFTPRREKHLARKTARHALWLDLWGRRTALFEARLRLADYKC